MTMTRMLGWISLMGALLTACAGNEGASSTASQVTDCGEHGSAHAGHCDCDSGYLYDGTTCVLPDDIAQVCEPEEHDADAGAEEHDHGACVCPTTGECPCEEGEVQVYGGRQICVPETDPE